MDEWELVTALPPEDVVACGADPAVPLCEHCVDAYRNGIEPGQTACEIRAREGAVSMNPDDVIGILTRSDKPEAAKVVQRLVRDLGDQQDTANRLAGQVEDVLGAQAAKDAELRKVYDEAVVLADGEAVDACILLLDAVKKFLA